MIKIRYSDLPAGLHVRTSVQGRHTILYLLPGLTATQRRAALHRARSNARVGYGPRLPPAGVACALAADRIKMTARNSLAAVRVHPAFLVPVVIVAVSVVVAYLLLVSVSIRFRSPQAAGPGGRGGIPFDRPTGSSHPRSPAWASDPASLTPLGQSGDVDSSGVAPKLGGGPRPGSSSPAYPPPFRSPSSSASPQPTDPGPSPGPLPGASPGRSPTPSPSPSPSPAHGGLCLDVGPLGVCVKV